MLSPIACKRSLFPSQPLHPPYTETYLPPSRLNSLLNTLPPLIRTFTHRLQWIVFLSFGTASRRLTFVCKLDAGLRARQKSEKFGKHRARSRNFWNSNNRFENSNTGVTSDRFGHSRMRSVPSLVDRNRLLPNLYEVELQDLKEQILLYPCFERSFRRSHSNRNPTPSAYRNCTRSGSFVLSRPCLKFSQFFQVTRFAIEITFPSLLLPRNCSVIFAPDRSRNVSFVIPLPA